MNTKENPTTPSTFDLQMFADAGNVGGIDLSSITDPNLRGLLERELAGKQEAVKAMNTAQEAKAVLEKERDSLKSRVAEIDPWIPFTSSEKNAKLAKKVLNGEIDVDALLAGNDDVTIDQNTRMVNSLTDQVKAQGNLITNLVLDNKMAIVESQFRENYGRAMTDTERRSLKKLAVANGINAQNADEVMKATCTERFEGIPLSADAEAKRRKAADEAERKLKDGAYIPGGGGAAAGKDPFARPANSRPMTTEEIVAAGVESAKQAQANTS